ncbi:MAG TPA: peptide MFS transporter [Kofleriaceae bacterium]
MSRDNDRAFFGHPKGLSTLFFTEMWERLSYYGMRAFLIIYMVTEVKKGGRGMSDVDAGLVMALYTSSVYLLSLPGGWIADAYLGQRRAVTVGAIGIMLGNGMLAVPIDGIFYPGLAMIALGTGLLKPNISTIVGQLYTAEDPRRDSGYTIYYMGINIGAFIAPLICGFLAQSDTFQLFLANNGIDPRWCWNFAFAAPAIGMALGLVWYTFGQKALGEAGLYPAPVVTDPATIALTRQLRQKVLPAVLGTIGFVVAAIVAYLVLSMDGMVWETTIGKKVGNIFGIGLAGIAVALFLALLLAARDTGERKRIVAMIPLFIGAIGFFGVFEQASSTLSLFAERLTSRDWLGLNLEASYLQAANSVFVITLAPVFAWLWIKLVRANKEPSSVTKFGIGMVFTALSFVIMIPTLSTVAQLGPDPALAPDGEKVNATYLITLYLFATCAELCISPVGLSSMSKLAPARMAGMVMGTWFLATAIGNYLAGRAAGFSASRGYSFLFYTLIISSLVIAAALFAIAPIIKKMMASQDRTTGPADKSEKAEPEPLPTAKARKKDD